MEITNVKKINQLDNAASLPSEKKNKNLLATITDPDTGKTYKGTLRELLDLLVPPSTAASPALPIPRGAATTTAQEGFSNVGGVLNFNGKEFLFDGEGALPTAIITTASSWVRIYEGSHRRLSTAIIMLGTHYNTNPPTSVLFYFYTSLTGTVVTVLGKSPEVSYAIKKIRVIQNTSGEFYIEAQRGAQVNSVIASAACASGLKRSDIKDGNIPEGYTATEFTL